MNWRTWAKGLLSAVIGGASNAALAMFVDPTTFNFGDLPKLGQFAAGGALLAVLMYLKASPLPTGGE